MSVVISNTVEVHVPVAGEVVTLVCRRPTAAELSAFLRARFETKGRRVKTFLYEARAAFIAKILVNTKNTEYSTAAGEVKELNAATVLTDEDKRYWSGVMGAPVEGWQDLIPVSWKSSAAMYFEDAQPEDEERDEAETTAKN